MLQVKIDDLFLPFFSSVIVIEVSTINASVLKTGQKNKKSGECIEISTLLQKHCDKKHTIFILVIPIHIMLILCKYKRGYTGAIILVDVS